MPASEAGRPRATNIPGTGDLAAPAAGIHDAEVLPRWVTDAEAAPLTTSVFLPSVGPPVQVSPWPDVLPGLGPRCVVAFAACEDCRAAGGRTLFADAPDGTRYEIARTWAPGTWAAYGGRPLCRACAETRAAGRCD
jgi:hypothetical protein